MVKLRLSIPVRTTVAPEPQKLVAVSKSDAAIQSMYNLIDEFTDPEDFKSHHLLVPKQYQLQVFEPSGGHKRTLVPSKFSNLSPLSHIHGTNAKQRTRRLPTLSVTSLLTKSWCELRTYYDVYASQTKPKTKAMRKGSRVHSQLESSAHSVTESVVGTLDEISKVVPSVSTKEMEYAQELAISTMRVAELFTNGEAREVKVYSFVDTKNGSFGTSESSVLVSGIIDHLILDSRDGRGEFLDKPGGVGSFAELEQLASRWNRLTISDVKTRSYRSVPSQDSVVESSELQVSLYRKILSELTGSLEASIEIVQRALYSYGADIDAPIPFGTAVSLAQQYPPFYKDYLALKNGTFRQLHAPDQNKTVYSWESFHEFGHILAEHEAESLLDGRWEIPLTLEYFVLRYSTTLCLLREFTTIDRDSSDSALDPSLMIEYYYKGLCFQKRQLRYDDTKVRQQVEYVMKFWTGERLPEPIEPTSVNFRAKCGYCVYSNECTWRQKGLQ